MGEGARRRAIERLQPDITHRIFLDAVSHRFTIRSEAQVASKWHIFQTKARVCQNWPWGLELSSERKSMNI